MPPIRPETHYEFALPLCYGQKIVVKMSSTTPMHKCMCSCRYELDFRREQTTKYCVLYREQYCLRIAFLI